MGPIIALIVVMAAVFGVCFLVDKGFTKLFRSKAQHASGKSVRLNKKFGSIGLIVAVLGTGAIFAGFNQNWALAIGGAVLVLLGVGMIVYYMSFGVYYDQDSFILTTFGRKTVTYRFADITSQQLYVVATGVLIELYLRDGKTLQLQPGMTGVGCFMKSAFAGWLEQTGRKLEDCDFYDPDNSCWFPPAAEQ